MTIRDVRSKVSAGWRSVVGLKGFSIVGKLKCPLFVASEAPIFFVPYSEIRFLMRPSSRLELSEETFGV
jgi:hypothetical protein